MLGQGELFMSGRGGDAVYSIFYRVARSGLDRLADRIMHAKSC